MLVNGVIYEDTINYLSKVNKDKMLKYRLILPNYTLKG